MRLSVNVGPLRVIGNLIAIGYVAMTVFVGLITIAGLLQNFQLRIENDFGSGGSTSLSIGIQSVSLFGFLCTLVGVYVVWKVFHMFLDMYEALADMQRNIARLP